MGKKQLKSSPFHFVMLGFFARSGPWQWLEKEDMGGRGWTEDVYGMRRLLNVKML